VRKHENVLEIGAGSGYMAALLANRGRHVLTVDIHPELVALARKNLADAGISNVDVAEGNAADGWAEAAPYDVICISASVPEIPQSILSQLKVGGRIAAIVGTAPVMEARIVTRVSDAEYQVVNLFETLAKPLQGAAQPSRFKF
jgi:protein-L-isoaspartate(D-aspartate) O-methyltransferase